MTERRLFFALWPDDSVRQRIAVANYAHLKPRTTPMENWHMTLVFLGLSTDDQQMRLAHAAAQIKAEAFDLSLDTTGQFLPAQVAWLGCRYPVQGLIHLQTMLERSLRKACPEHPALISAIAPYCPHVTLYRNIRQQQAPQPVTPVNWPVRHFHLIESRRGCHPVYRLLDSWALTGA